MGLPARLRTNLSFDYDRTYIQGTLPGTNYGACQFKLTSPYDPYNGTGTTQPPLFDNYTALYSSYIVNKCTIYVRSENYTAVPIQMGVVAMFDRATNAPTFPNDPATYNLSALNSINRSALKVMSTAGGGSPVKTISKTFYPSTLVGRNYFTSVNYAGTSGADPANMPIGQIIWIPQASGTESWGAWFSVRVTYDVTFYDQKIVELATED